MNAPLKYFTILLIATCRIILFSSHDFFACNFTSSRFHKVSVYSDKLKVNSELCFSYCFIFKSTWFFKQFVKNCIRNPYFVKKCGELTFPSFFRTLAGLWILWCRCLGLFVWRSKGKKIWLDWIWGWNKTWYKNTMQK